MSKESDIDTSVSGPIHAAITSSDAETDSTFRKAWLKDPQFRSWVQETKDPHLVKCTICTRFLKVGKSHHLRYHANSATHRENTKRNGRALISVPSDAATISVDTSDAGLSQAPTRSSDTKGVSSSGSSFVVPAAKALHREQAFRKAWLKDPQFRSWLRETEDPYQAKCRVCWKLLAAKKTQLQRHADSAAHIRNIQRKAGASVSVPGDAATKSVDASVAAPSHAAATSSNAQTDSSSDNISAVPAETRPHRQAFRDAWLKEPQFRSWLEPVKGKPYKAWCRVCWRMLASMKSDLIYHGNTRAHCTNLIEQKEALTNTAESSHAATASVDAGVARPANAAISSSDAENGSSSDTTPAAKKGRVQAFRKAWLKDPQFRSWLRETEDPYEARCTVCSKSLGTRKSHLQHHANTTLHSENMERKTRRASISVNSDAATTSVDASVAGPSDAATTSVDASVAGPSDAATTNVDASVAGPSDAATTNVNASVAGPSDAATTSVDASVAGPSQAAIRSSDTQTNSSSENIFAVPAEKKPKRQAFGEAWLHDPQFRLWLEPVKDKPYTGWCRVCWKLVTGMKSDLINHANSRAHCTNMLDKKGALTNTVERTFELAEMRVCLDAVEHNRKHSVDASVAGPSHAVTTSVDAGVARPANAAISSPDAETDSNSDTTFAVPAAKKRRVQAFRKVWLKNPQFQPWLQETKHPHQVKCTICTRFLIARKSCLQHHANTTMHSENVERKARRASISVPSGVATTSVDASVAGPSHAAITSLDASVAGPSQAPTSSSDTKNVSSSGSTFIVPAAMNPKTAKTVNSTQAFNQVWLLDPHCKLWLPPAAEPQKPKCTIIEARVVNMVHPKEGLTSTVERTFADNVKVAEGTMCIGATEHDRSFQSCRHFNPRQNGEDKRQCEVDEVPSTSSATEAASTGTRRNGETPTTTPRIQPILHDHRYAKMPRSMWKQIFVQKKQILALKREMHVYKQHHFRLKKQVTSLKRIVNKLRSTRALPDSGLEKNIKQKQ